ncbi:MAG: HAD-IIB family hydrolase [Wenzhouxiangella sp.]|jgi:HAD superfamily hydrolase (TIGR01484 family)|nr:HAD-IIB family hydrolase [Wenzhouxiangella sp.]
MTRRTGLSPHSQARYLLCSDLDRTLIPNGLHTESPGARDVFHRLVDTRAVCLVYVTGRNRALVEQAIEEFSLPWPDAVIGDVGTRIWSTLDHQWNSWSQWDDLIRQDFTQSVRESISEIASQTDGLTAQTDDRQTEYKLSYYCPVDQLAQHQSELQTAFVQRELSATVVASQDETSHMGLIDVLPSKATKHDAIEMLMAGWGFNHWSTVCAGDSGNDLPFLTSALQSVLVANADDSVREEAIAMAQSLGQIDNLYLARGGIMGMNGCYAAGVVEGFLHYFPNAREWLD